jgi:hypothetical protein
MKQLNGTHKAHVHSKDEVYIFPFFTLLAPQRQILLKNTNLGIINQTYMLTTTLSAKNVEGVCLD